MLAVEPGIGSPFSSKTYPQTDPSSDEKAGELLSRKKARMEKEHKILVLIKAQY
jgi:hypothetical protein